jgi:N-acetylneuraminic acid mutarotase
MNHIRTGFAAIVFVASLCFGTDAFTQGMWTIKAPMPVAVYGAATGVINGQLYVAGGCCVTFSFPYTRFNTLQVYDPIANTWTTKAPMPLAVYAAAAGVINGKLYVAGGQADPTNGDNVTILQIYDPATDTWTSGAPLPQARSAANAGIIGGKLYVAGGTTPSNIGSVNTVAAYDPASNSWTGLASMPTPRAWAGAAVINGILYVVGGLTNGPNIYEGVPTNAVESYNPITDTWTGITDTLATKPIPRFALVAGAINGTLYVAGGTDNTNTFKTVESYDPVNNTWVNDPSKLPSMRVEAYSPAAGVIADTLYLAGGNNLQNQLINVVQAFAPAASNCTKPTWAGLQNGQPQNVPYRSFNPANHWAMNYSVSDTAGLMISDISLAGGLSLTPRYMARQFSLPHYSLTTDNTAQICNLKPDGSDPVCRSRLIDLTPTVKGDPLVIEATYAIDQLPDDPTGNVCLTIKQRYEFNAEVFPNGVFSPLACELSGSVSCARFYPLVSYQFDDSSYSATLKTLQRLHFDSSANIVPDATNKAAVFHDCNLIDVLTNCTFRRGKVGQPFFDVVEPYLANPVPNEISLTVFQNGNMSLWDNYHQTYRPLLTEPGGPRVLPPGLVKGGCPECVHIHWRWSTLTSIPYSGQLFGPQFNAGNPLIPDSQTVQIAVVLANGQHDTDMPEPFSAINSSNASLLSATGIVPVLWYGASSDQTADQFFTHGGFFSSTP